VDKFKTASDLDNISALLERSETLNDALTDAIGGADYRSFDRSDRVTASVSAASVAWEHAGAARLLAGAGMFTTAFAVMRLQHEALTRSIWLTYVASELDIAKLSASLSKEAEVDARRLPMAAEMIRQLASAPMAAQAVNSLQAFVTNNSPALNSFVHGGIHALQRHANGYPAAVVQGVLRNSNGLLLMTAMSLAILSGQQAMKQRVVQLQLDAAFKGVLPES
jgi:hypothetical protein